MVGQNRTRRRALISLVALVIGSTLAIAGCGGDDGPTDERITVQYLEFESFDPHVSAAAADWGAQGMVFRGLYKLNRENEAEPEMADGMPDISNDGLTYTINLKDDLEWSDGTPLVAEDFVAGIVRTCAPEWQSYYAGVIGNITGCAEFTEATEATDEERAALEAAVGVKATDDDTIEFTLNNAQPTFTVILTLPATYPVPRQVVETSAADWPDPANLVFNGPYTVSGYTPGESIVFERNESYGGGTTARIAGVTFRFIDDAGQSNNAFRTGEVLVARADKSVLAALQEEFPDELVAGPPTQIVGLATNLARPPLDNLAFRKALALATDRETIGTVVLQGAGRATTSWTPAAMLGLDEDEAGMFPGIAFDTAAAQAALTEAGYPGGQGAPGISILVRDDPSNLLVAEYLQQQWSDILGLDVTVERADNQSGLGRIFSGEFDLTLIGWAQDYADPGGWMQGLFNSDGGTNFFSCSDSEIDRLLSEALYNPDNDERIEQYREANARVSGELCGIIPMYLLAEQYLVSESVSGPREYSTSQDRVLPGDWAIEEWRLTD